jgi:PPM family protein phosphatase
MNAQRCTKLDRVSKLAPLASNIFLWLNGLPIDAASVEMDGGYVALATNVGTVRSTNEDRTCCAQAIFPEEPERSFFLAILCDGVGSLRYGGESASVAAATVMEYLLNCADEHSASERITHAIYAANRAIFSEYGQQGGTTCTCVLLCADGEAVAVNVGDSRLYGYSVEKSLQQLSIDDTFAGQLQKADAMNEDLSQAFEFADHLLQFVGMGDDLNIKPMNLRELNIDPQRGVLALSDGVYKPLGKMLNSILVHSSSPMEAVRRLVQVSVWAGGHDNASAFAIGDLFAVTELLGEEQKRARSAQMDIWAGKSTMRLLVDLVSERQGAGNVIEKKGKISFDVPVVKEHRPSETRDLFPEVKNENYGDLEATRRIGILRPTEIKEIKRKRRKLQIEIKPRADKDNSD